MIDIFNGKPPTQNPQMDDSSFSIQRTIRELLRIARNTKVDRRKITSDRRRQKNDDVVVNLSHRRERRATVDRRQNQGFLIPEKPIRERRKNRFDRRQSVNDGVHVKLSTREDNRSGFDRRGDKHI